MKYKIRFKDHSPVREGDEYGRIHGLKPDHVLLSIPLMNRLLEEKENPRWWQMYLMIHALVCNNLFKEAEKEDRNANHYDTDTVYHPGYDQPEIKSEYFRIGSEVSSSGYENYICVDIFKGVGEDIGCLNIQPIADRDHPNSGNLCVWGKLFDEKVDTEYRTTIGEKEKYTLHVLDNIVYIFVAISKAVHIKVVVEYNNHEYQCYGTVYYMPLKYHYEICY